MKFIPLMVPSINEKDIDAVSQVLRSGLLVQGRHVEQLETNISNFTSSSHAVAVSNGTASLHLALMALGVKKGDEVIVPAFSYVATANVVEIVGATPIFVDVVMNTFNIDVSKIEKVITARTKAIIPVHEFGLACDITKVLELAEKYNLFVIEDAACALGATENGKQVGSFGEVGSFSLHPRKNITSGEGGVITTNNKSLSDKIKVLRNHGINPNKTEMEFIAPGYNYRLTEFQAALVNSQLERLSQIITRKQKLAQTYLDELLHPFVKLPSIPKDKNHTWQTFHVVLDEKVNRDKMIMELRKEGVGTNYGAQCIPEQIFYKQKYRLDSLEEFPCAYRSYKQGLALPLYEGMSTENIKYISKTVIKTINRC